jgi:hypothetical protein
LPRRTTNDNPSTKIYSPFRPPSLHPSTSSSLLRPRNSSLPLLGAPLLDASLFSPPLRSWSHEISTRPVPVDLSPLPPPPRLEQHIQPEPDHTSHNIFALSAYPRSSLLLSCSLNSRLHMPGAHAHCAPSPHVPSILLPGQVSWPRRWTGSQRERRASQEISLTLDAGAEPWRPPACRCRRETSATR